MQQLQLIPPWGRPNPLPGTWTPRTYRRGDDRSPGPSSPGGTSSGAYQQPLWATSDFLLSKHKRKGLMENPRGNNCAARSTRWGKRKRPRCAADRFIPDHGTNKGTGLHGAGAHGFCAALTEQTCHGGFVCQAELPLVLVKKTRRSALKKQPSPPKKGLYDVISISNSSYHYYTLESIAQPCFD